MAGSVRRAALGGVIGRGVLNVLIGFLVPATVGVAALLAEDLLPKHKDAFGSTPARWIWFVSLLVCLGGSILWRSRLARRRGTLYYLRVLDDAMPDWHLERIREIQAGMLGFRRVTRSVDAGDSKVVDLRRVASELTVEFERLSNDDDQGTGYHVAPNMLWPAAIAFGYEWCPPRSVQLCEYNNPHDDVRPEPDFCWKLEPLAPQPQGKIGIHTHQPEGLDPERVKSVLIDVYLTSTVPLERWDVEHRPEFPCQVRKIVGVVSDDRIQRVLVKDGKLKDGGDKQEVTPEVCVVAVSTAIQEALAEFPHAVVVLVSQMPKTVALGVGWQLARDSQVRGSRAHHPWRRLVPVAFIPPLRPAWVRFDQPDPKTILVEAGLW